MTNDDRTEVYLRTRSTLTPAQRRRIRHRANAAQATLGRATRRSGHRQVRALARVRRQSIRLFFARRSA